MKSVIIATLLTSAAAFAPAQTASQSTSLAAVKKAPVKTPVKKAPVKKAAPAKKVAKKVAVGSFEDALGAQPPLGFYDPLGLVADGDQAEFDRLRFIELKHGRISMLAVLGYLVQENGIRLPGNIDFSGHAFADIPNGWAALSAIPGTGLAQIIGFIGILELAVMKDITGGEFVGDFRNNYIDFGWDKFDEATKLKKRAIELNQGRAAQMGILALMVHEQLGVSLIPH